MNETSEGVNNENTNNEMYNRIRNDASLNVLPKDINRFKHYLMFLISS